MFHILKFEGFPIYDQLLLEERLLREDKRNWCIINFGSTPAIVMGISGKKEELVNCASASTDQIPLIKRFSGGGTVIVDENTLFVTFICQKEFHPFSAYPEPIMKWTESIYKEVFGSEDFRLRENDYIFKDRKFGGNAQYIKKDRWLHHTSFLWDYSPNRMAHLLHPKKTPNYRGARSHEEFLCKLSSRFSHPQEITERLLSALEMRYGIQHTSIEQALTGVNPEFRRSTFIDTSHFP